jgi:hypothetical protein
MRQRVTSRLLAIVTFGYFATLGNELHVFLQMFISGVKSIELL